MLELLWCDYERPVHGKDRKMKQVLFSAAIGGLLLLAACSTFDGVGKDVSAAGRGISHVANEVRDEVFDPEPTKRAVAKAGEPCDPNSKELKGGSDLPACPAVTTTSQ